MATPRDESCLEYGIISQLKQLVLLMGYINKINARAD